MSGICGICRPGTQLSKAAIEPMLRCLGKSVSERSLRLVAPAAVFGAAPQGLAAVRHVRIAADADIYNWPELLALVGRHDIQGLPQSVPERLAWLYLKRGPLFVELIEGAFAIGVWDEADDLLTLACDRFGMKRLYWRCAGGKLYFASHIAGLRSIHRTSTRPEAIMEYLTYGTIPAPLSIDQGTERLPPGFLLSYGRTGVRQEPYGDLDYSENTNNSGSYWATEVHHAIQKAVRRRFDPSKSGVTGAFLSGGTDSSSIVKFMSELEPRVNTFGIVFTENAYDESRFADTIHRIVGTSRGEKVLTPEDAVDAVPRLMACYGEPFGNSSAIAAYHCALLAKQAGMSILLAGDGGDEIFAGNAHYARAKTLGLYDSVPSRIREFALEPLVRALAAKLNITLPLRYVSRASLPEPRRYLSYNPFLSSPPQEVFEPEFLNQVPPDAWLSIADLHFRRAAHSHWLNRLLYHDMKVTIADNDLLKIVGVCELAGILVRFPMLDRDLVNLTCRIPARLKMRGFEKRYIFKRAMKGTLPRSILHKKKHGFGIPMGLWLLEHRPLKEVMQDLLLTPRMRHRGYLRPAFVDNLVETRLKTCPHFYGEFVWRLMALELWHRYHYDDACK